MEYCLGGGAVLDTYLCHHLFSLSCLPHRSRVGGIATILP